MKKTALIVVLAMLVSLFSFSAMAADPTLVLNAEKGVAYTLTIPTTPQNVDLAKTEAQSIGSAKIEDYNFTSGKVTVTVSSLNNFNLKLDQDHYAAYTLTDASFDLTATAAEKNLSVTMGDVSKATVAGTYSDTLTFAAVYANA